MEKVKSEPLAVAGLKTTIAALKMSLSDTEGAEALLKECEEMLNVQAGVTPTHVAYYRVTALLKQQKMEFAAYYTEALRFLGCVTLDDLSVEEKAALCMARTIRNGMKQRARRFMPMVTA